MVAPVQGTVGKSSLAPATQDYLNELTNFYNKKENEGVESEFVSPDGSKYKIKDASYLSTVKSNVNTGKFDAKAEENNKALSSDADTSVGSYAADKKAKADKANGAEAPAEAEGAKDKADSSKATGTGTVGALAKVKEQVVASGAKEPAMKQSIVESEAKTVANQEAAKETFKKMDEDAVTMTKTSAVIVAKTTQTLHKAVAKRKAAADQAAAKAAEAAEGESSEQSGAKMGFSGTLATTAGGSTGSGKGGGATDKAWENTMKGKIAVQSKLIATETPKLINIKTEGAKAAQPLIDQSSASNDQADSSQLNRQNARKEGDGKVEGAQVQAGIGAGFIIAGGVMTYIGYPMLSNPVTAAAGTALVGAGVSAIGLGTTQCVSGYQSGTQAADQAASQCATADLQTEQLKKQSQDQLTQSSVVRRQAIAQAQAQNVKIIKSTQALNKVGEECTKGLSSSEASAINTDGMDEKQLESVKQDRYNQIMAHEQEHSAIIGGSPVIETDANGVAIGGYVQIDVPSVDEADLEGTIEKAQQVIDAALAPSDPSSQDQSVASQAKDVLSKAQDLMAERAEKAEKEGEEKPEEVKEEPKEEIKEDAKKAA